MKYQSMWRFSAILLTLMLLFTSCLVPKDEAIGESADETVGKTAETVLTDSEEKQIRYYFANINRMLKTVPDVDGALVMLDG